MLFTHELIDDLVVNSASFRCRKFIYRRECEFKLRWRGLKRVNSVRGQGSRLIDRVSGSSQPGASPVVPNSPPRNGKRDIRVTLMDAKHRDLLTETEVESLFLSS